jgi:hypothetical protein
MLQSNDMSAARRPSRVLAHRRRTGLTLAEWLCRTADRIDPSRVSRSRHHPGRSAFASDSAFVRNVLQ